MKVGWINNNELIFGNTADAGEGCGGVTREQVNGFYSICASVGNNFSV